MRIKPIGWHWDLGKSDKKYQHQRMKKIYATTYFQVPNVPDLLDIFILVNLGGLGVLHARFEFETLLVGEMEQTDEAEAGTDLFHLVAWV
jgi:hypothetical protein